MRRDMKAAKRPSGWYCQSRSDVRTHISAPHTLSCTLYTQCGVVSLF